MYLLSEFSLTSRSKKTSAKTHATNALGVAGTAMSIGNLASAYKPGSRISNMLSSNPNIGKIGIAAAGAYGAKQAFNHLKSKKRKKKFI